jgi:hypothetical protein
VLISTRDAIGGLWNNWDSAAFDKIAANNLAMDLPGDLRKAEVEKLKTQAGACRAPGQVHAENLLRGRFRMSCDRGEIETVFTLAPTNPASVQYLRFDHIGPLSPAMRAYAEESAAKNSCRVGDVLAGDGVKEANVRLECEGGKSAVAQLKIEGELKTVQYRRAPGVACLAF